MKAFILARGTGRTPLGPRLFPAIAHVCVDAFAARRAADGGIVLAQPHHLLVVRIEDFEDQLNRRPRQACRPHLGPVWLLDV